MKKWPDSRKERVGVFQEALKEVPSEALREELMRLFKKALKSEPEKPKPKFSKVLSSDLRWQRFSMKLEKVEPLDGMGIKNICGLSWEYVWLQRDNEICVEAIRFGKMGEVICLKAGKKISDKFSLKGVSAVWYQKNKT